MGGDLDTDEQAQAGTKRKKKKRKHQQQALPLGLHSRITLQKKLYIQEKEALGYFPTTRQAATNLPSIPTLTSSNEV